LIHFYKRTYSINIKDALNEVRTFSPHVLLL